MECLAKALCEIFGVDPLIDIIGTRHGEKLYETLVSSDYHTSVNTSKSLVKQQAYTSHNTYQLTIEEVKEKLLNLSYIQEALKTNHEEDF